MARRWSFNRSRDQDKIKVQTLKWEGPYCLPKYEVNGISDPMPDLMGVYLFSFPYKDGFIIEAAGITKSTKKRIATHVREYQKGNYNILDMEAISRLERIEIWHGWSESKKEENQIDFKNNYEFYSRAIELQLSSYRLFIAKVESKRVRERIEAAIMLNAYLSKEPWADIVPRWMFLKGRYNYEIPILINNEYNSRIIGLPDSFDI